MTAREGLYTPSEVARLFRVDPKTVSRWQEKGLIGCVRTPGGTRRYRKSEIDALLKVGREDGPPGTGAPDGPNHPPRSA